MKKLPVNAAIILSSLMAVGVCTSANAAPSATPAVTQSEKGFAGYHKNLGNYENYGKKRFSELNLTADQEAKIKAIMQKNHSARGQNFEAMKAERQALQSQIQSLTNSPTLNNTELNRLANLEAEKSRQRFISRVQTQREIAQVLTADQRQKLATMRTDRQKNRADSAKNRAKAHPRVAQNQAAKY